MWLWLRQKMLKTIQISFLHNKLTGFMVVHKGLNVRWIFPFLFLTPKEKRILLFFCKNWLQWKFEILIDIIAIHNKETQKEYRHKQSRIVSYSPLALLHMTNLYWVPYHGLWRYVNKSIFGHPSVAKRKQAKRVLANSPQSKGSISLGGCSRYKTFPRFLSWKFCMY